MKKKQFHTVCSEAWAHSYRSKCRGLALSLSIITRPDHPCPCPSRTRPVVGIVIHPEKAGPELSGLDSVPHFANAKLPGEIHKKHLKV